MTATPSITQSEISSQPAMWAQAAARQEEWSSLLPPIGARVLAIGCGTSLYIAQAFAARREALGQGETDAAPASEAPVGRSYDSVVTICRSGTTTEVLRALAQTPSGVPTVALVGTADTPVTELADATVLLDFVDETSVVQTRFATTAINVLRSHLGDDMAPVIADGNRALAVDHPTNPESVSQVVFLGASWSAGLAQEAALKCREAAGAWTEAYLAMEYRHGPISAAGDGSLIWSFTPLPEGLEPLLAETGATIEVATLDPVAELVRAQRFAVALAEAAGRNPDTPLHLTRSVVLT
jgi:fructoselysine-6-P-deglycase FrlB-like protein